MDKSNRKIILREIDSWRKNRLLPAEYCDFLSNLYSEGETFILDKEPGTSSSWRTGIPWRLLGGSLVVTLLLLLSVLHFTSFPNWMQICVLIILTIVFYILAFLRRLPFPLLRVVFLAAACLMVALDGYYVVDWLELKGSPKAIAVTLLVVLLVWIFTGVAGESRLIVSAAWTGVGVLYGLALHYVRQIEWSDYWLATVYWLIYSLVSVGVGLILGRIRLFVAPSWATIGVLAVMAPDFIYIFSGLRPDFLIDVTAFLKISLIITFAVVFRREIQNWLDRFKMRQL